MTRFSDLFLAPTPIIGVIHLPALPGSGNSPGLGEILKRVLRDFSALEHGGVHGVLVVNDDDEPRRLKAGPETISTLTRVGTSLKSGVYVDASKVGALMGIVRGLGSA